jgi:hypothetical protein
MRTEILLKGHKVSKGKATGEALVSQAPLSFYGGIHPETGFIIEKGHELEGVSVSGKVLVFPTGKGSTAGAYILYELATSKKAPKAIINISADPIVAAGAIISDIPMVDKLDRNPIEVVKAGDLIEVNADQGLVRVLPRSV